MKNIVYVSVQGSIYLCAKAHLRGVYSLGPNFDQRYVFEIPYTINRYDTNTNRLQ